MKPLTPASPHAIIMVGIPGSGKSTFAEHFADTFQAPIINESRIAFETNTDAKQVQLFSAIMLQEILKAQRTFIIEAAQLTKNRQAALIKTVTKAGFRPLIVWVQTETNEAKRRASKALPVGSGLSSSEFDLAIKGFTAPIPNQKTVVISGKHTYATQLKVVLKQLAGSRPETPSSPPPQRRSSSIVVR